MEKAYIEAKLNNEHLVTSLRNRLYSSIGASYYYIKTSPHITIVPPFYIDSEDIDELHDIVENYDFSGKEVKTQHLMVWDSLSTPEYVMLDVDLDIKNKKEELKEELKELNTALVTDPVPYHVTLFSTRGWWDEPSVQLKRRLQMQIADFDGIPDTSIRYTQAKVK